MKSTRKHKLLTVGLLILPTLALALAAQQSNSFVIAGQPGSARVIQMDGLNYVEVEGLARLTNGSISFNGNQIVMALPGATSGAATSAGPEAGFSKEFVVAGVEVMAQIREWRAALRDAVAHSYRLTGDWLTAHRAEAQQALRVASVSARTSPDRSVLPFLTNEFENMRKLSDKYVQMSAAMTYIAPDAIDNDALDRKILTCARSLASMANANQFIDDGSCQ